MLAMLERKGHQVAQAEFTKYIETVHSQSSYTRIATTTLRTPGDMKGRMEKAIRKSGINKAIGADGIHVGMLQVTPELSASLLHRWWETVVRTGAFPEEGSEGIIYPLLKNGAL